MHLVENVKKFFEKRYKLIVLIFFILFLIISFFSVNDYGYSTDETDQKNLGNDAAKLVLENDGTIYKNINKYHGTTFTYLLTIIQRIFNIESIRTTLLLRHYATFLLFYISVIFFYFLCRNIFKSWKLGLLGSVFLVLSPRIFAESFYNPKDIPFLSFFIISIFTLHKLLETRDVRFVFLHGISSGFAVGIRIIGIIIPFFTIMFLIFYLLLQKKQKKGLKNTKIFKILQYSLIYLFVTIVVFLVLMPSMLLDPANNFIEAIKTMSDYPLNAKFLYMGQNISSMENLPWHYLPVNIAIMTPVIYTILFFIGLAYFVSRFRKNLVTFYTANKYIILAILWFFIPMLSQILLSSNLYNGWRQMYFIYPAFLIIALSGVKFLYDFCRQKMNIKKYNIVALAITAILIINLTFTTQLMIRQHPYQYVYHNILAGKNLGVVKSRFILDYWGLSFKDGLEYILKTDKRKRITYALRCGSRDRSENLFSESDKQRLVFVSDINEADYFLNNYKCSEIDLESRGIKQAYLLNKVYSLVINEAEIQSVYKLR